MAGQTYQVNYVVNVDKGNSLEVINAFKRALSSMDKATKPITDLQRKVVGLVETMSALNRGQYTVKIDTSPATRKIGKLIRGLKRAQQEVAQLNSMGIQFAGTKQKRQRAQNSTRTTPAPVAPQGKTSATSVTQARNTARYAPAGMRGTTNLGYKLWGPTPLPNNGGMAIDMLKGMGIAYGIAGLGTAISTIVNDAAEYDNLMKTVENILKSHDTKGDFINRFSSMTRTVRNVGMETKFKVTEVADAAKFLAMAGLDLESIQKAIRPIADIALIGDTELGQTADLVTNIMTAYNIAPEKMRWAADIMTNTFTMSNTTLTEIAESYKYAASLLSAGGVSFEDATAAIGVLGDAGIKGSQAGTTLRTIMANVVNPTKKQRAAWDAIGVSRFDQNGEIKDLIDIFRELHDANLRIEDYYRLFHKTAASGAVALTSHIDKWEQVSLENFLSQGLSVRLAEEKKNTLQGLWAQFTSVLTDRGVTAFGNVQGGLRGLIRQGITWLKDEDENGNDRGNIDHKLREIGAAIMDFLKTIIQASKWFFKFYEMFAPMIKMWVKFQLTIWPVVKAITAFRSVFLGLSGLRNIAMNLYGIFAPVKQAGMAVVATYEKVATAAKAANTATANTAATFQRGIMTPYGFVAGSPNMGAITLKQLKKASKGLELKRPHSAKPIWNDPWLDDIDNENKRALKEYKRNRRKYDMRIRRYQAFNAAKSAGKMGVSGGLSMLAMSQMTRDGANGWDMWSGGLFAAAGVAAMIPVVGWVASAVLAAGGAVASLFAADQRVKELSEFVNKFSEEHKLLGGVLLNGSSQTERHLEFVWRRNYNINELIQRRIELKKEEMGLDTPDHTTPGKDAGNEVFQTMYDKIYAADSFVKGSKHAASKAATLFNNFGSQFGLKIYKDGGDWYYQDFDGNAIKFNNPEGDSDEHDAVMYSVAAAMEMLQGGYRTKIIDENQARLKELLYGKGTSVDASSWMSVFRKQYGPESWVNLVRPDQLTDSTEAAKLWSGEEIAENLIGAQLLWGSLSEALRAQRVLWNYKSRLESGNLTQKHVVDALKYGDDRLGGALANYSPNDIGRWFQTLGYNFGDGVWRDPTGVNSPETMATTTMGMMQDVLKAIDRLPEPAQEAVQELKNNATALLTYAESFLNPGEALEGAFDGQIREVNGQKWKWSAESKRWGLLGDNGNLVEASYSIWNFSNNVTELREALGKLNDEWPVTMPLLGLNDSGRPQYYNGNSGYNYGWGRENELGNSVVVRPLSNYDRSNLDSYVSSNLPYWAAPQSPVVTVTPRYSTVNIGLTPEQMGALANKPKDGQTNPLGNTPFANNPLGTTPFANNPLGTTTSDYKPSQRSRAVPKQINISIQNLMNVDSIDLTNSDNKAVIENVKREVAYALVEAAADATEQLNGLSA